MRVVFSHPVVMLLWGLLLSVLVLAALWPWVLDIIVTGSRQLACLPGQRGVRRKP
jgi:hypothetical protein